MTRRIYLDLYGVMADFDGTFPSVFGLDHRDMADDDMWLKINGHPSFFRDLPPMAGAVEFFRSIEHLDPIILTACPKSNYAHVATQKVEWVRAHLSAHVTVLPVLGGSSKPLFMHAKGDILIDDYRRNTEAWAAAGGNAILHRGFDGTAAALAEAIGPYARQPAQPVEAVDEVARKAFAFDALVAAGHVSDDLAKNSLGVADLAHPRPTGDDLRIAPVEKERFEAWMKRDGGNTRQRDDGVYADHTVMCCWNAWWMSASFKTDTSLTTVPYALADVVRAVRRFDECAEDGEDVNLGRDWFDALTTLGLLTRVQRSPARWEMTEAGHSLLSLAAPTGEQAGEVLAFRIVGRHGPYPWVDASLLEKGNPPETVVGEGERVEYAYAQPRPMGVPDGWKLVPVKATREVTEAGRKSLIESGKANVTYDTTAKYAYEDMIAAAPATGKVGEA